MEIETQEQNMKIGQIFDPSKSLPVQTPQIQNLAACLAEMHSTIILTRQELFNLQSMVQEVEEMRRQLKRISSFCDKIAQHIEQLETRNSKFS